MYFLRGYEHKYHIFQGFTHGFKVGYIGPRSSSVTSNLKSCYTYPSIVADKIAKEVQLGRVKGPFGSPPFPYMKISPIGIVPKKTPGQYRLIHHLSCPEGNSVNDFIDKQFSSVQYATFDDAVECVLKVGPNCLMGKTDIDSAFRLLPVHDTDHPLLGFQFNQQIYYDTCVPFGASSSCALFTSFSNALVWIAKHKLGIEHIVHILDDFLIVAPANSSSCNNQLNLFLSMCKNIGVPIKAEKTEFAKTCLIFMGLELDSVAMEARLPLDKLQKLRSLLNFYVRKRTIKLKDLQSLLGLLNFCCKVVVPGRCFLRLLYNLTRGVTKPNHHITLTKEGRKDLKAWPIFVNSFNGKQLLLKQRWITSEAINFFTDAAGSCGFGAVFQSHWFFNQWPADLLPFGIAWKELFPIVLALEIWGPDLKNKCITLHSDNEAVVHMLNKQTSKDTDIMHLVRRFVLSCMKYNLLIHAVHIPGKFNVLPDALSRLQIDKFRSLAPWMDKEPALIPDQLLQIS